MVLKDLFNTIWTLEQLVDGACAANLCQFHRTKLAKDPNSSNMFEPFTLKFLQALDINI